MKVAIAFIGTSNYLNFLPQYYEKIIENFLPNSEKIFLVFTDGEGDFPDDVKVYHQEHLQWPYITLNRFDIINKAREEIIKCDWFVFLDADTIVVDQILENDFFTDKPLFGVWHPCHYMKMPPHDQLPGAYETNKSSLAYIDVKKESPHIYYQGCFWGGRIPEVLDLIDELKNRIAKDLNNDVIAIWHDESHLNKYFLENEDIVKTFGPEYAYPEDYKKYCNFQEKIVHISKNNQQYHKN